MDKNSNNIRNIYIKCTKTYNKKNFHKSQKTKEENMTEKNNIFFIKNNNLINEKYSKEKIRPIEKPKQKGDYQSDTYNAKNNKNKMINGDMDLFIDNIRKDDNIMIHNINLINSTNNITVYDSLQNIKKDYMKYPLNQYNSQQKFNKSKNQKIKNNVSMDFNFTKSQKANILVNRKRVLLNKNSNNNLEYKGYNSNTHTYKNNSLTKKKNPFKELNFKKLNLSGNNNSISKFNEGSNYSNFNKQQTLNTNTNTNTEYISTREVYFGELSHSKKNNNSLNKRMYNDNNTTNNNDLSAYNTYSNYTSSIGDDDINSNKNKNKFFIDKYNDNNRNIINVNKLENLKITNNKKQNNKYNTNQNLFNIYKNDNSDVKISSNSSSNILSLLSNKSIDNYNKSKFSIENLTKIKKNMNNEKLYKTKSKDSFNNNSKDKRIRNNKKTKSEEKMNKKNKTNKILDNKDMTKRIKIFSSFLNENNKINNNITKKNGLGNIYINDAYSYNNTNTNINSNTFNTSNKFFYSTFNSDNSSKNLTKIQKKKNNIYPNRINDFKEIPQFIKMNISDSNNENYNDNNIFEKIEVNKASFPKNNSKIKNKKSNENLLETRNESLNLYVKKTQKESWLCNSEQANSFSKNMDYYCYLSNYKSKKEEKTKDQEKSRKKSAPKKIVSNIIYSKKQLLCHNQKSKPTLEDKIISPDYNKRKQEDKHCSKRKKENYEEREESLYNINYNTNENIDDISGKNINQKKGNTNKTYLIKSPISTVYKKPGISNININISNEKDSFSNKLPLCTSKVNENENLLNTSKKKKKKIYLNFKLNKFIGGQKDSLLNDNNNINKRYKKNKININLNSINYKAEELSPKIKENKVIQTINSYKPQRFSLLKLKNKIHNINSFTTKYYCYYIDSNYKDKDKENCFISKIRLNKNNLTIYEIPIKKICYFSIKRKIKAKTMPKIEICFFKKDLIRYNNNKVMNDLIGDENLMNNNDFDLNLNKKDFDDNNIKFNLHQNSFASINSNENGNNYFEISFGKKVNKSLININNENIKNDLNNNDNNDDINSNKYISPEKNEKKTNNNYISYNKNKNKNKSLNDNIIDISPSKISKENALNDTNTNTNNNTNNNSIYLKKTEKGLKLLEKIAGNRISPFSNKKVNIFDKNKSNINDKVFDGVRNDFIELLNMVTVNNFEFILNKISCIILNNNIITIDNISQLLLNQNIFIDVILNKSMTEKKYIKIYSKLCKDLFISLMSIVDNYNDDMDIFDKITKDKSLKVVLKNKILEKINIFAFNPENETKYEYFEMKIKMNYLMNFIGELLEIKIISLKSGFEILELLYRQYIKGNSDKKDKKNIIYNDLNLDGIEILLNKMKKIIYEKKNLEHIQRYNIFIKNYLNNIFKNRIKSNDLSKCLYYKLFNLIENQKNEEEIKKKEKVKTFINYKNKNKLPKINDKILIQNSKNNSFTVLEENNKNKIFSKKNNIENHMIDIMKKDIKKFIYETNINEIKNALVKDINKRYNDELNLKKSIDIWDIFYYYIEACIDLINNEDQIYIVNEYIENIINTFTIDLPNETWEMLHFKLISLFLNINEICSDNIYMHEVMGFLLFLLINYKLFFIKDLNNFLNKENEIIINIAKVVKYTIIYADKDAKKYHNDFKQTKLFIGNDNFYNIVTKPLSKKYLLTSS